MRFDARAKEGGKQAVDIFLAGEDWVTTYEADLKFFMGGRWNLVFDELAAGETHLFAVEIAVPFG